MGSYKVVLSLALTLVLLTPTCLASFNLWGLQDPLMLGITGQIQPRRLSRRGQQLQNECNIERLNANEPNIRVQAEAGVTEIWNSDDPEFRCAGVTVIRHVVEPGGLVQPFYANAPALTYVEEGEALAGVVVPGCPETYESGFNEERDYQIRGKGQHHQQESERSFDRQEEGRRGTDERRGERQEEGRRGTDERRGDHQQEGRRDYDDRRGDRQQEGSRGYDDSRGDRQHEGRRGSDRRDDRRHESGRSFEDRRSYQEQGSDRHQKVRRLREGDIFALPAGFSTWFHNHGERRLVLITMYDTSNFQNQLDQNLRKFYLAGNPQESSQGGQSRRQEDQGRRHSLPFEKRHGQGQESSDGNNVLGGFNDQLLSDILRVNKDTIRQIQGNKDERGNIIYVQGNLRHLIPDSYDEEQQFSQERGQYQGRQQQQNGLEETLCTAKLTLNIDEARKADVFNPKAGRFTSLNSNKLPILNFLQLNANRVRLYPNAILAPHWKVNAHTIAYYTKGSGRVQVVDDQGNQVFDDQVQQGQLLVFPQNYVVLKQADQDGLEWVEFLTNDQAMISPLAGRTSIFHGLPEEVIESAYLVSKEEARKLKYNREEITVLSPSHGSSQRKRSIPFSIV